MSPAERLVPTPSQTVGPFFHFGLAPDTILGCLVPGPAVRGERIRLRIRVVDGDGEPVPDALVEIYQADAEGRYAPPGTVLADGFCGFGRLATDAEGTCEFETIRPGRVPDGLGGLQSAHINICLFARGLLRHLYTRLYLAGDSALADDPVLALVPEGRRRTLVASQSSEGDAWAWEIALQGEHETVFFALNP